MCSDYLLQDICDLGVSLPKTSRALLDSEFPMNVQHKIKFFCFYIPFPHIGIKRTIVGIIRYLRHRTQSEQDELRRRTEGVLAKAVAVLQLAVVSQFGCGVDTTGGGDRGT